MKKKTKIKFENGITKIHMPTMAETGGESMKAMRKMHAYYKLPQHSRITFQRSICLTKGLESDLTEVIIEK